VIGWPSDIERWTIEDLQEYFRRSLRAQQRHDVVAGDVTPEEVFGLAEKYFGPIPPWRSRPRRSPKEPPQIGERRVTTEEIRTDAALEMAFHIGASADKTQKPA